MPGKKINITDRDLFSSDDASDQCDRSPFSRKNTCVYVYAYLRCITAVGIYGNAAASVCANSLFEISHVIIVIAIIIIILVASGARTRTNGITLVTVMIYSYV